MSLTFSPLKNGWFKDYFPFGGWAYFQGRSVKLPGSRCIGIVLNHFHNRWCSLAIFPLMLSVHADERSTMKMSKVHNEDSAYFPVDPGS